MLCFEMTYIGGLILTLKLKEKKMLNKKSFQLFNCLLVCQLKISDSEKITQIERRKNLLEGMGSDQLGFIRF